MSWQKYINGTKIWLKYNGAFHRPIFHNCKSIVEFDFLKQQQQHRDIPRVQAIFTTDKGVRQNLCVDGMFALSLLVRNTIIVNDRYKILHAPTSMSVNIQVHGSSNNDALIGVGTETKPSNLFHIKNHNNNSDIHHEVPIITYEKALDEPFETYKMFFADQFARQSCGSAAAALGWYLLRDRKQFRSVTLLCPITGGYVVTKKRANTVNVQIPLQRYIEKQWSGFNDTVPKYGESLKQSEH